MGKKNGYIYGSDWFTWLCTWNEYNIVNQLYLNKFFFKKNPERITLMTTRHWCKKGHKILKGRDTKGNSWPPTKFDKQNCTFFFFSGPHLRHMEVPRLGVKSELQLQAYTIATTTWDLSRFATLTTAHLKAGSLTHWARPGIEPESSWILVWLITSEPQWELSLHSENHICTHTYITQIRESLGGKSFSFLFAEDSGSLRGRSVGAVINP